MSNEINLTWELARLLKYTASVATAIRMNSPYNSFYDPRNPEHANDVMWLADSLHNLDMLGMAVQEGDPGNIASVCDLMLRTYERYQQDPGEAKVKGDAKGAFERNAGRVRLEEGAGILLDIKAKVRPYLGAEG